MAALAIMDDKAVYEAFANKYVCSGFRSRFVHEATKKPDKLLSRICHDIESVIESKYRGANFEPSGDPECLALFDHAGFRHMPWSEASQHTELGDGCLIITAQDSGFYAESEATKGYPSTSYATDS